jgi:hypothetical protein
MLLLLSVNEKEGDDPLDWAGRFGRNGPHLAGSARDGRKEEKNIRERHVMVGMGWPVGRGRFGWFGSFWTLFCFLYLN